MIIVLLEKKIYTKSILKFTTISWKKHFIITFQAGKINFIIYHEIKKIQRKLFQTAALGYEW